VTGCAPLIMYKIGRRPTRCAIDRLDCLSRLSPVGNMTLVLEREGNHAGCRGGGLAAAGTPTARPILVRVKAEDEIGASVLETPICQA